ncbi:hypothetical protein EPN87_01755, partial [archaeon]
MQSRRSNQIDLLALELLLTEIYGKRIYKSGNAVEIRFIICDLGGVYFTDGTSIALRKINEFTKADGEIIDDLFRESPEKEGYLLRIGKLDSKEFWSIVSKKLNLKSDHISAIREMWHSSYEPINGMKELIQKLRKNYKVVAFSGTFKERVEYLDSKYGLLNDFDDFVFSFDYKMNKKNPDFYRKLLEAIDAKPEE